MRKLGDVVGARYTITAQLGQGGMGVVFAARDRRLGRDVALKALHGAAGSSAARRLEMEAQAIASLAHPGIVALHDVIEDAGDIFLVMELVEGESLRARLAAGALPAREVSRIITSVADALATAHARGLVHRDVKPDNVIVRSNGRTALLDFGVAKAITSNEPDSAPGGALSVTETADGAVVGTPAYLAPEQARGEEVTAATDQFALAVLAYELLTGELPWPKSSLPELIAAIVSADPPSIRARLGGDHPNVDAVLARAMSKAQGDRYPDIISFAEALTSALVVPSVLPSSGADVSPTAATLESDVDIPRLASSASRRVETKPAPSRRRTLALIAAVPIVALAIFGLYRLRNHSSAEHIAVPDASVLAVEMPSLPGAAFEYEAGLDELRHRSLSGARRHFEQTLVLDPAFAPAHVELLPLSFQAGPFQPMNLWEVGNRHYAEALRARAKLSPRSVAILDSYEPLVRDPHDAHGHRVRMEAAVRLFPTDAEILYWAAGAEMADGDEALAQATTRLVLAADPTYGPAYYSLATWEQRHARPAERDATIRTCLERAPASSSCRALRFELMKAAHACGELEQFGRDWLRADPGSMGARETIADGLYATDGPIPGAREQLRMLEPAVTAIMPLAMLDASEGQFDHAARALETGMPQLLEQLSSEAPTLAFVRFESEARSSEPRKSAPGVSGQSPDPEARSSEPRKSAPGVSGQSPDPEARSSEPRKSAPGVSGRSSDVEGPEKTSLAAIREWTARSRAWQKREFTNDYLELEILHRSQLGGAATRAEWIRARDLATATLRSHPGEVPSLVGPDGLVDEEVIAVLGFDHRPLDRDDARDLIAFIGGRKMNAALDELLAEAHVRLGEWQAVIDLLRRKDRPCPILDDAVSNVREHLWLGMALEQLGDIAGARVQYEIVTRHWGSATPPSTSASLARARLNAIGPPAAH